MGLWAMHPEIAFFAQDSALIEWLNASTSSGSGLRRRRTPLPCSFMYRGPGGRPQAQFYPVARQVPSRGAWSVDPQYLAVAGDGRPSWPSSPLITCIREGRDNEARASTMASPVAEDFGTVLDGARPSSTRGGPVGYGSRQT